jgi:hypothetical protein
VLPLLEQIFGLLHEDLWLVGSATSRYVLYTTMPSIHNDLHVLFSWSLCTLYPLGTYPLLPWLADVLIRFEQPTNVHCLPTPNVTVDGPVEGELEGAAVEFAGDSVSDSR